MGNDNFANASKLRQELEKCWQLVDRERAVLTAANERIRELEANEAAYERILGKRTYQEVAENFAAERAISDKLEAELTHQKVHNYNPFEPDNQCANYKRIDTTLTEVAAMRKGDS